MKRLSVALLLLNFAFALGILIVKEKAISQARIAGIIIEQNDALQVSLNKLVMEKQQLIDLQNAERLGLGEALGEQVIIVNGEL